MGVQHLRSGSRSVRPPVKAAPHSRLRRAVTLGSAAALVLVSLLSAYNIVTRGDAPGHQQLLGPAAGATADPRLLLAPVLVGGPSNQLYQAKEAVLTASACREHVRLVMPPLLPHFSAVSVDRIMPLSAFFDLVDSDLILEEGGLLAAYSRPGTWPLRECLFFYASGPNAKKWQEPGQSLLNCGKFSHYFQERTNGSVCKRILHFPYTRTLCDLAAELKGRESLVFGCNLELSVQRHGILDKESVANGSQDAWIHTARAVRLRHRAVLSQPTLTVQMRAPDYVLSNNSRRDKLPRGYSCLCMLRDCLRCVRDRHIYAPTEEIVAFIRLMLERKPVLKGISAVHVMTNDHKLAATAQRGLTAAGYAVTVSTNGTLEALMHDYDVAVQSRVFWATQSSSIATNIVHARWAEGTRSAEGVRESILYWEQLWHQEAHLRNAMAKDQAKKP